MLVSTATSILTRSVVGDEGLIHRRLALRNTNVHRTLYTMEVAFPITGLDSGKSL